METIKDRLEEYGDLHGGNCSVNMENPDACDCEEMKQILTFIKEELNGLAQTIESEALLTGRHEMIHAATIIRTQADLL